jgi:hypothetical protein
MTDPANEPDYENTASTAELFQILSPDMSVEEAEKHERAVNAIVRRGEITIHPYTPRSHECASKEDSRCDVCFEPVTK